MCQHAFVHAVVALDKFRGTATAAEACAAAARALRAAGWTCDEAPMADGGEGFLDALGGPNRSTVVSGPLGDPVEAAWRIASRTAVVEMARASGLEVVGGSGANDPVAASSYGTGELIQAAVDAGARRVLVGVGGSATTDGGLGAVRALHPVERLRTVELIVACDVRTRFLDAAEHFAPQKGASPAQVRLLRRRLERVAQLYEEQFGIDVRELEGSGAAGGLAGGLAAIGAELVSGFDLVAEETDLERRMRGADLVVTGEGALDEESFEGKVVGGTLDLASHLGVPTLVVVGEVYGPVPTLPRVCSLVERFGAERARNETLSCLEEIVTEQISQQS